MVAHSPPPSLRKRLVMLAHSLLIISAVLYPVLLVGLIAALHFVGERFWATGVALFLPRWLFGLPLPLVAFGLWRNGNRRLLWTQALALLLVLFPLMGFVVPSPDWGGADGPRMRVLSCNMNSGYLGYAGLLSAAIAVHPDVVMLQEIGANSDLVTSTLGKSFPHVHTANEFVLASRYRFRDIRDPQHVVLEGRLRSARFMRYLVETPLGDIAFYNVHPVSPRSSFYALRGRGFRREILSGRLFIGANAREMQDRSAQRETQLKAALEAASGESVPVLVAGDLNLAGLSPLLGYFSDYQDGFAKAGWGFGYTYPTDKFLPPFLRLDRIFASDALRFASFEVLRTKHSDHWCVYADLKREDHQPSR